MSYSNKNPESWVSCSHKYRVRVEYDQDAECPIDRRYDDGILCIIQGSRWAPNDKFVGNHNGPGPYKHASYQWIESGEHDAERQETMFYRRAGSYGNEVYLTVSLTEGKKKYTEFMGKPCLGRFNLIQWINKNLDAEETAYNQWADGEVYGFILERRPLTDPDSEEWDDAKGWEEVDSCWGFVGEIYEGAYIPQYYIGNDEKARIQEELSQEASTIESVARGLICV